MRGLTSTIAGLGLLAVALGIYWYGGSNMTVVGAAAGSLILLYRGYQGLTIVEAAGDAMTSIEFATNPRGAIMDFATDQATDFLTEARGKAAEPAEESRSFDPDAIIARYLENRGEDPPASDRPASSARTFGRKGL